MVACQGRFSLEAEKLQHTAVRKVFWGKVTYASAPLEEVDWNLFNFVSLDCYREARYKALYGEHLKQYFCYSKPVIITEVGCCTYQGAENAGGRGWLIVDRTEPKQLKGDYVRDEDLQAHELTELLTILEGAGVDGAFVFTFVSPAMAHNENPRQDLDMASYSLVKSYADKYGVSYSGMPWEPKESFRAIAKYFAK